MVLNPIFFFFSCVLLPNSVVCTRRFVQGAAQSLPRVVCPYALSANLCQRLKTKNLVIYYNKEPEQRCMTDHCIKNNPLSSFENKQRSVSNISYMVFFKVDYFLGIDRDWRECRTDNSG
jgi:hypothetical protein